MFVQAQAERQVFGNGNSLLLRGDLMEELPTLDALEGQAQCVIIDPPFRTGKNFSRTRPFGQAGWSGKGKPLSYPAFNDALGDPDAYDTFLEKLITRGKFLLKDTGMFCLHLDWRSSAKARLLCDRIFGEENFINEIIWSYESGGRAWNHFSRKHDVILMYAKGPDYRFDLKKVPIPRTQARKNHMKKCVDEDGRFYSSITTNGKEYRYYDDEPTYPGDVWTDISHLQQRDPERTGYATQKPARLLERLLKPVVEPGDLVADLCCGSGTTLAAAQGLGCRFLGMDISPEALSISLSRLKAEQLTICCPTEAPETVPAVLSGSYDAETRRFTIGSLAVSHPAFPETFADPLDPVESWAPGILLPDGTFVSGTPLARGRKYPSLNSTAIFPSQPDPTGIPAVLITDAASRRYLFTWVEDNVRGA